MKLRSAVLWVLAPAALCIGSACSLPAQRADFRSSDPQERTLAVGEAARSRDTANIPALIQMLASPDPAERMLAINALEDITGETRGYRYWAPEGPRREAMDRWVAWYEAPRSTGVVGGAPTAGTASGMPQAGSQ